MLITAQEVINLALPNKNMDSALLSPSIPLAELKYMSKALGKPFFDALQAQAASGQYLGLNQYLHTSYLKPCLARYVVYEALPMIKAEVTANGLQTAHTDYAVPISNTDFAMLRNKFLSDAETLLQEMLVYLKANAPAFPDFKCTDTQSSNHLPFLY
ncbi:MAG: hypothetical protein SFW35_00925 [Chitinophagales bacterium]|nr:hypothetical protein [Chitinophagales bacterium]